MIADNGIINLLAVKILAINETALSTKPAISEKELNISIKKMSYRIG